MNEPFVTELRDATKKNDYFRQVLFSGEHSQLVLMSLDPGEEIGTEVHAVDQLLYAVAGDGEAILDGSVFTFEEGGVICVPAGVEHNIVNTSDEPLKPFTVYAPPSTPRGRCTGPRRTRWRTSARRPRSDQTDVTRPRWAAGTLVLAAHRLSGRDRVPHAATAAIRSAGAPVSEYAVPIVRRAAAAGAPALAPAARNRRRAYQRGPRRASPDRLCQGEGGRDQVSTWKPGMARRLAAPWASTPRQRLE
jgi:mannose-6-phosphate isomerase-like protein (cupin superfamily)